MRRFLERWGELIVGVTATPYWSAGGIDPADRLLLLDAAAAEARAALDKLGRMLR